ncbi:MFS transporter [Actinomadura monticuli]|uniref:MFS transporter n=1 Tax=Actinomadura monticuli TaxID=3097367 RepID=A0ABV4Q7N1_9ACTN
MAYVSAGRAADAARGVPVGAGGTGGSPESPGAGGRTGRAGRLVAANVIALGAVSMITDVSSEMVTAVLPLYLVAGLGLSPLAFGFLDGLYGGVTALVRLLGGHAADRWRRRKLVAGIGYGLSAITKPALLVAGTVPVIGAVLAADRTGKGLRTAPRDALISLSSPAGEQGRAFGVHRAMDTAGALLGPLVAFGILALAAQGYDAVFMVSTCVAAFGVLVLVLFVRDRRERDETPPDGGGTEPPAGETDRPSLRVTLQALRLPGFARICVCAPLLGVATLSDSFVYLLLQRRVDLPAHFFPLLPVGTAAAFLLLAVPLGLVSDRIGRLRVFLAGHAGLLVVYGLLLSPLGGAVLVTVALALHGAFYAATDGVLMALAGPLLPENVRAGALAVLQTGQATARLACSVGFGAAWTWWGPRNALLLAATALVLAAAAAAPMRPETRNP